jgi:hypothetical protein
VQMPAQHELSWILACFLASPHTIDGICYRTQCRLSHSDDLSGFDAPKQVATLIDGFRASCGIQA